MKTLTFYNLKGGVGKTAAAVNIAYLASLAGYKTLLCDLDPQGSTSFYLRIRPPKQLKAKTVVKGGKALKESIRETDYPNLDLLPAALSFRRLERDLAEAKKSKDRIGESLGGFRKRYDLLVVDAPPSIGLEAENLLRTSDLILVPTIPTVLSANTLRTVLDFSKKQKVSREKIAPFISMADGRRRLHREITEELLRDPNNRIKAVIPYASAVERMGLVRQPVVVFSPRSKATAAFKQLWEETASLLLLQ
jgi:cellulose biosynthesis protein BcsQ